MKLRIDRRRRRLIVNVIASAALAVIGLLFVRSRLPDDEPYTAGEDIEGITEDLARGIPDDYPRVMFSDVAQAAGLDFAHFPATRTIQLPEDMGSGAAWADYDGDGWIDLFLVNVADTLTTPRGELGTGGAGNRLFRNRGDGTFEDVSAASGLGESMWGMGAAWADMDLDGDPDLAVSSFGGLAFYRNDGADGFVRIEGDIGEPVPERFWTGLAWGDYDADGDPDLYVCGYVDYEPDVASRESTSKQYGSMTPSSINPSSFPAIANLLYRNDGDGRFTEVAEEAGVANPEGRSLAATWSDLNEDGWLDLYVANDVSDNALYLSRGDGTFLDSSTESFLADYRGAMGLAVGDWDRDLDLDLFVTHWVAQENALYSNLARDGAESFEEDGASPRPAFFMDVADRFGLGQIALDHVSWGTAFIDYDLDGRLDLFTVNGHTLQDPEESTRLLPMRDALYWNDADAGYFEVAAVSGTGFMAEAVSRGAAVADYDGDGDPDIAIIDHGGPVRLLRNDGATGHWVKVRLEGAAHRHVAGARIEVVTTDGSQLHEYGTGASYLSQHAEEAIFGLGTAATIDRIEVRWPGGDSDRLDDVPADRVVVFSEDGGGRVSAASRSMPSSAAAPSDTSSGAAALGERERVTRFWVEYRAAIALMKKDRDWPAAAEGFQKALELDPEHEDSLYSLGQVYLEMEDHDAAAEQFERLVEVDPRSLRGQTQIAKLHSMPDAPQLFDLAKAEAALERALAINPEESGSLILLGTVRLAAGHSEAAAEHLAHARAQNFRAVEAYYLGGYIEWQAGNRGVAVELLGQAVTHAQPVEAAGELLREGDTRGDYGAASREAMTRRSLFGPLIADLVGKDADSVDESVAAVEYASVERYLDDLSARQDQTED